MQIILKYFKLISKMSGITNKCQTKAKGALKVFNSLNSYLFEQEYGELSNCTPAQKKTLKDALLVLNDIIKNNK